MFKKIIIICLIAQSISISAGERKRFNLRKLMPAFWLFGIDPDKPAQEQAVLGVASTNLLGSTQNIKSIADKALDPSLVEKASQASGHGFVYGSAEGAGHAIRDGAQYVRDTANAHPILATGVVGAALAWYFIPSQEDMTRKARLKEEEALHKATEQAHKVALEKSRLELSEMEAATTLRTCLNTHHGRKKTREQRVPSPCNSPVRRLAAFNAAQADTIINGYNKYA